MIDRLPRLVVAQAARANPLYRAFASGFANYQPVRAGPTLASAIQIGNPVSIDRAIRTLQRFDGVVEEATEAELSEAAARADRTGMFTCPHTGVALAALEKLTKRGVIGRHERTVVISTANALKFAEFKVGYHEQTLADVKPMRANSPMNLPDDYEHVRRAVFADLENAASGGMA